MEPLDEQIGLLMDGAGITRFLASMCLACVKREHHARAHGDPEEAHLWAFLSAQTGAVCERILAFREAKEATDERDP